MEDNKELSELKKEIDSLEFNQVFIRHRDYKTYLIGAYISRKYPDFDIMKALSSLQPKN